MCRRRGSGRRRSVGGPGPVPRKPRLLEPDPGLRQPDQQHGGDRASPLCARRTEGRRMTMPALSMTTQSPPAQPRRASGPSLKPCRAGEGERGETRTARQRGDVKEQGKRQGHGQGGPVEAAVDQPARQPPGRRQPRQNGLAQVNCAGWPATAAARVGPISSISAQRPRSAPEAANAQGPAAHHQPIGRAAAAAPLPSPRHGQHRQDETPTGNTASTECLSRPPGEHGLAAISPRSCHLEK